MERRFFLQLLGLGSVASQVPLLSRQAEARTLEASQGTHLVIGRGFYTGRLFERKTWTQGVNAGLGSSWILWRTVYPMMTYDELDQVDAPNIPGLDMRSVQALQLYRQRTAETVQQLLTQAQERVHWGNTEDLRVVTLIREPLKILDHPQGSSDIPDRQHVKIHSPVEHYIFQGKVSSDRIWSTTGELPLEVDFGASSSEQLHSWFDEQTRANIVEELREPKGPSLGRIDYVKQDIKA